MCYSDVMISSKCNDSYCVIQDWRAVVIQLKKTGKDHLKRRLEGFEIDNLKISTAKKAKIMLEQFTFAELEEISIGAATVYNWVGINNSICWNFSVN